MKKILIKKLNFDFHHVESSSLIAIIRSVDNSTSSHWSNTPHRLMFDLIKLKYSVVGTSKKFDCLQTLLRYYNLEQQIE